MQHDGLVPRGVAANQFHLAARAIQVLREKFHQRLVCRRLHGRGGDFDFSFLHGSSWVEVELSAKKPDANAVVLKVAEAAGRRFDALDFRVQSFRHGVGDVMALIRQQVFQMPLAPAGHVGHRFAPAAAHPSKPVFANSNLPADN